MKPRTGIARIAAIFLGLLVLYPLSIGPAMYIDFQFNSSADREFDSSPGFARIYTPLFMLYGRYPAYDRFLGWYIDLWRKVMPVKPVLPESGHSCPHFPPKAAREGRRSASPTAAGGQSTSRVHSSRDANWRESLPGRYSDHARGARRWCEELSTL